MRSLGLVLILALFGARAGAAHAQPGATPPPPAPSPYAPPPYAYPPPPQPVALSDQDRELLARGEISDGQHLGGGLASFFFGFGLGQAVQGRWSDTGWIFTLGEIGSIGLIIWGADRLVDDCYDSPSCDNNNEDAGAPMLAVGVIGLVVFRAWEIVDAISGPVTHNRKVRDLRMRLGYPPPGTYYGVRPYVAPTAEGDGSVAGIRLAF